MCSWPKYRAILLGWPNRSLSGGRPFLNAGQYVVQRWGIAPQNKDSTKTISKYQQPRKQYQMRNRSTEALWQGCKHGPERSINGSASQVPWHRWSFLCATECSFHVTAPLPMDRFTTLAKILTVVKGAPLHWLLIGYRAHHVPRVWWRPCSSESFISILPGGLVRSCYWKLAVGEPDYWRNRYPNGAG